MYRALPCQTAGAHQTINLSKELKMINTKERAFGFGALIQTIRNFYFFKIFLKIHEYNEDKEKWEFKPFILFRIKWEKLMLTPTRRPSVSNFTTAKCIWCPYNFFKITSSYSEWYNVDFNTWVRTDYLEKYLWQKNFIVVRTEKYNEDDLLEDMRVEHANQCAGYGVL